MNNNNKLIALLLIGIWIGLVGGLSFIEAPLKFQAPGITLSLGLGIGKLVFGTLNKIEIVASIILIILYGNLWKQMTRWHRGAWVVIIIIVAWQSLHLLPVLDSRADLIVSGESIPSTYHHWAYIIAEFVKLVALVVMFFQGFWFGREK